MDSRKGLEDQLTLLAAKPTSNDAEITVHDFCSRRFGSDNCVELWDPNPISPEKACEVRFLGARDCQFVNVLSGSSYYELPQAELTKCLKEPPTSLSGMSFYTLIQDTLTDDLVCFRKARSSLILQRLAESWRRTGDYLSFTKVAMTYCEVAFQQAGLRDWQNSSDEVVQIIRQLGRALFRTDIGRCVEFADDAVKDGAGAKNSEAKQALHQLSKIYLIATGRSKINA